MKAFVAYATKSVTSFRTYADENELYNLVKDAANWSLYMVAVEDGKVVYEFLRGKSPVITKRTQFKTVVKRNATEKDMKRIRFAYSRRLINCSAEKFGRMMTEAEKEGII